MESNAAGGGAGGRGGGAPAHSDGPLPERLSFRLLVPASAVAQIIGRGGENVTAIQSATRARIDVTSSPVGDLNHVTFVGAPFGICVVSAELPDGVLPGFSGHPCLF